MVFRAADVPHILVLVCPTQCDQKNCQMSTKVAQKLFHNKIDFDTFTKIVYECGRFGHLILAKGFKNLPKVQKLTQSGHSGTNTNVFSYNCPSVSYY